VVVTVAEVTSPTGASRSAVRREQLLAAAERVVMRDGPEASMNTIAAEAGITKPILYRHFGDKGGLYRALAERHIELLLSGIRHALTTPGPRRDRTAATIDAYLSAIEAQPQVYRFLMHRAADEEPGVRGQVALFMRRLGDEVGAGIARERGRGPEDEPLAQAWGHGIVGRVQAAGDWWLEKRATSRATLVTQLTDLLWGGWSDHGVPDQPAEQVGQQRR
jgi:AcrR family transcriptional regulator